MPCFVLAYRGDGISVKNFLACGDKLVPRTNQAYGLAAWTEITELSDIYVRDPLAGYMLFGAERGFGGAMIDGPVAIELGKRGLDLESTIIKKGMLYGRYPTSGVAFGKTPDQLSQSELETARNECHPFLHARSRG